MNRKFLKPLAVSIAALMATSQAQAAIPDVVSDKTAASIVSAKPLSTADLVIDRAGDSMIHFAQHQSHRSHSSHSSHSSHRSHYSSSY
jgi:hypothetical protein